MYTYPLNFVRHVATPLHLYAERLSKCSPCECLRKEDFSEVQMSLSHLHLVHAANSNLDPTQSGERFDSDPLL